MSSAADVGLTRLDLETIERFAETAANKLAANKDIDHITVEPSTPFHSLLTVLLDGQQKTTTPICVTRALLNGIATKVHGRLLLARNEEC
jgi:hypothetical protein